MKQRGEEEKDASAMEVEGEEPRPKPELMIFGKPLRRQMVGFLCPAQHHAALCSTGFGAPVMIDITSWFVALHQVFQLVDLEDRALQRHVMGLPRKQTCTMQGGWFRVADLNDLRKMIKVRPVTSHHTAARLLQAPLTDARGVVRARGSCRSA
jgi:hypothetical protein